MKLKWITKSYGTLHYCYVSDTERIVGRVYESMSSSICDSYYKDDEQKDFLIGQYISLSSAKKAIEEKYAFELDREALNG